MELVLPDTFEVKVKCRNCLQLNKLTIATGSRILLKELELRCDWCKRTYMCDGVMYRG